MHERTKIEAILITTRSQYIDFFCPNVITTTVVPERFFYKQFQKDITEFAQELESHILQSPGAALTYEEEFTRVCQKTGNLILRSLRTYFCLYIRSYTDAVRAEHVARPDNPKHVFYTDIDSHIT